MSAGSADSRPGSALGPPARGLVLDYGGVICFSFFELHARTERLLGLASGALHWQGPFDPASDPLWCDMLADRITERDYWHRRAAEVGRLLGETWDEPRTMMQRAYGHAPEQTTRPEALATVAAARAAGRPVAVLSNELDLFNGPALRQRLPVLQQVDAIVDATYTGILKPDPRAYQAAADALGLPLADCLMVDDQPRNIDGALRAGMAALWFDVTRPADCYQQVRQRLGLAEASLAT